MIWIYRIGYFGFIGCLALFALFSKKIRRGFLGRFGLQKRLAIAVENWNSGSHRFWFHVASAGELEQALPILDSLRTSQPSARIVLTYFSPSAEKAILAETKRRNQINVSCPWDFADFSPFDFSWTTRSFLKELRPRSLCSLHRELWPELIYQCRLNGVPAFLFAAFFPKNLSRLDCLYRFSLKQLSHITTVDEQSRRHLLDFVPGSPISILGDPRMERVVYRKNHFAKQSQWSSYFSDESVFIGASLWEIDFEVLLPALINIHQAVPECRFLLVPHEPLPHRVDSWIEKTKSAGLPFKKWSQWLHAPEDQCHLIVDQVGILAELYGIASCVMVGGSFKRRVHNVLEPLAYQCGIVTGPFIHNSFEATELAKEGILQVVQNPSDLAEHVASFLKSPRRKQEIISQSEAFLKSRSESGRLHSDFLLSQ